MQLGFVHSRAIKEGFADVVGGSLREPLQPNTEIDENIFSMDLDLLIIDEAHSIKNPDTHLSYTMRTIPARSRIALTNTPDSLRLSQQQAQSSPSFSKHKALTSSSEFGTIEG